MFRCEITGELSEELESPEFVVIEKRKKEYFGIKIRKRKFGKKPTTSKRKGKSKNNNNDDRRPPVIEKIGEGWEIAKTIMVRKSTLEKLEKEGKQINCKWVK